MRSSINPLASFSISGQAGLEASLAQHRRQERLMRKVASDELEATPTISTLRQRIGIRLLSLGHAIAGKHGDGTRVASPAAAR